MTTLKRWPWIALALGAVVALTPPGREFIHNALFSNEALSRNIARPFLLVGLLVFAALALIEWYMRMRIARRSDRPGGMTKETE